jgi:regulator of protease activity HflC (stomatin/prohibitin superfamily)
MPYLLIVLLIIVVLLISRIKIVPQATVFVIERLGSFKAEWHAGVHFLVPFIDKIAKKVSIKEQVVDFKPQPVITKDNVTMQIDTVVFFQVINATKYVYGVDNPIRAIENLTATTLRNIIGELELDATLTSRDTINSKITQSLDLATDRWGIKINRVELKNIVPPREIQEAMEKQMKAERERREKNSSGRGRKEISCTRCRG